MRISRKTMWGIVTAGMLIVAMAGTVLAVDFVTIVTGSTGGTCYSVGTIIANSMNKELMAKGQGFCPELRWYR